MLIKIIPCVLAAAEVEIAASVADRGGVADDFGLGILQARRAETQLERESCGAGEEAWGGRGNV